MTSEACPFCGKLFKRLKAHLPHCKAAGHTKTPPASRDVLARTSPLPPYPSRDAPAKISPLLPSYSPPASRLSENTTKKSKKLAQTLSTGSPARKSKKESSSPPSTALTPIRSEMMSSSLPASTSSSTGSVLPSTSKKKKLKLTDQIKMAAQSSFANSIPPSTSPVSPNPSLAKPQKKSLRATIEASRSKLVPVEPAEGDKSTSLDLSSAFTANSVEAEFIPSVSSGSHAGEEGNICDTAPVSAGLKFKGIAGKKGSWSKKRAPLPSVAKASAASQEDIQAGASGMGGTMQQQNHSRVNFWEDTEEEVPVKEKLRGSESRVQAMVTLQHVRATVGRPKANKQASKAVSIMDHIEMPPVQAYDIRTSNTKTTHNETERADSLLALVTKKGQSHGINYNATDPSKLNPENTKKCTKSKEGPLLPHLDKDSTQPKTTLLLSPVCPPLSGPLSSLVALSAPLGSVVNLEQGLSIGRNNMEPVTASQSASHLMERTTPPSMSSSSSSSLSSLKLPVRAEERLTLAKSLHEIIKPKIAEQGNGGMLTDLSLGQVRLRDVPEWLSLKMPSHPRDAIWMLHRGWKWYYRRYIDVRKGGIGGVAMLLGGYCVLSYIWSYPNIKLDRWRKYH